MEQSHIGRKLPRVDGAAKATGRARFGADIHLPGMLYAKFLRSPYPHAVIKRIDYRRALELEGVMAVITSEDFPPPARPRVTVAGEIGINIPDIRRAILAEGKVLYHGHAVAAVAAVSPHIAEDALELIEVEYEPLPVVEDPLAAMDPEAPLLHPDLYTRTLGERPERPSNIAAILEMARGDVEAGFREADVVLENTFRTQMVHQGFLEPQAAAVLVEPDGRVTVWTTTQGPFIVRAALCALFGLPQNRVRVIPMEVGGGFGGKINPLGEAVAYLLARKSGRPVKVVLTREEVLKSTYPGSPAVITIRTGARRDGRLTALEARLVFDAGCFPGGPLPGASISGFAPYRVPNLKITAYDVVTNKPKIGALRAPGATQATFALESQMDMMAEALNLDPLEFRRINALAEGDPLPHDRPVNRVGLRELLERVSRHPAWTAPLEGKNRGRGLACGCWLGGTGISAAQIILNEDATFSLTVGTVDLTGSRTGLVQLAADTLGVSPEEISISVGDTDSVGYTEVTGGSRTIYSMGNAVYQACLDLLNQLKERAASALGVPADAVEYRERRFYFRDDPDRGIPLSELARTVVTRGGGVIGKGLTTRLQPAPAFAVHVVDVEVDPETGRTRILKYTAFQDVGRAVNPSQIEAQIHGGVVQGIGWALSEGYVFDRGVLLNPTLLDYRQPTAADAPPIDIELVEVPASDGPFGVRGVGEAPIVPPPAAIANAIYRATGVRIKQLPMTPERVFWELRRQGRERL